MCCSYCRLSQCNIEQKGCYHLASSLQKNPVSLKVLDLSINTVGNEGANELFKKFNISNLRKLEWVWLSINVVGPVCQDRASDLSYLMAFFMFLTGCTTAASLCWAVDISEKLWSLKPAPWWSSIWATTDWMMPGFSSSVRACTRGVVWKD